LGLQRKTYEGWDDFITKTPIFQEGSVFPSALNHNNEGIHIKQKQVSGTATLKYMAI